MRNAVSGASLRAGINRSPLCVDLAYMGLLDSSNSDNNCIESYAILLNWRKELDEWRFFF